jgi:hypothetical protein
MNWVIGESGNRVIALADWQIELADWQPIPQFNHPITKLSNYPIA